MEGLQWKWMYRICKPPEYLTRFGPLADGSQDIRSLNDKYDCERYSVELRRNRRTSNLVAAYKQSDIGGSSKPIWQSCENIFESS